MKKKNILNRAMFRQVKSPAYGTGISANLVSSEERQRYNYGGRVRAQNSLYVNQGIYDPDLTYSHLGQPNDPFHQRPELWYQPTESVGGKFKKKWFNIDTDEDLYEKIYGVDSIHGPEPIPDWEGQSVPPYKFRTADSDVVERDFVRPRKADADIVRAAKQAGFDDVESYQAAISDTEDMEGPFSSIQLKQAKKRVDEKFADQDKAEALTGEGTGAGTGVDDTTMLDMESIIDKYYDKKGSLGKGQLGLAGAAIKAGFQKPSDAAATVGDALGAFGTGIAADKETFKKLAATGEIQRELYKTSRSQEGVEDRKTAEFKNALPKKENEAWSTSDRFDIGQAAAMKANLRGDDMLAYSVEYAMPGTSVKKLTGGADKTSLQKDAAAIQGGDENTLYIKDGKIWQKDSSGKLTVEVDFETIGLIEPKK